MINIFWQIFSNCPSKYWHLILVKKLSPLLRYAKIKTGSGSALSNFIYDCWTLQQGQEMKLFQKLHQLCSKGQAESAPAGCAVSPSGNSVPSLHLYTQASEHHALESSPEVCEAKNHEDVPRCCICRIINKSFLVWCFSNFHIYLLAHSLGRHSLWKILVEQLINYNKFWWNGSSHN